MKKSIIICLMFVLVATGGLLFFSFLVEGSNLGIEDWKGKAILEDQYIWTDIIVETGEVYMAFEAVEEFLYPHIEMNEEMKKAFIKVDLNGLQFEDEKITTLIKGNEITLNFNLKEIDGKFYLPIKSLENLLEIEVNLDEGSQIVMIDKKETKGLEGTIVEKINLKFEPKGRTKTIATLQRGDKVRVYGEEEDFYYVRTTSGDLGYVSKDYIHQQELTTPSAKKYIFNNKEVWKPEGNIGLVWDYVHEFSKNRSDEEKLSAVDVVSPTWFDLTHADGTIKNKGDFQYIKVMKEKNYKIWGLVTNSFDPNLTSEFLGNKEAQNHFIKQILIYSGLYQLDGINIDFENIHYRDKDAFTKFVALLTEKLHQMNLVVSIDVTIPSNSPNWSMVYDREKLGKIVDYVAVMTYDEHWAASPKSGSVASIGWVERGIQRTLELVPKEKVLMGIPFYTRLWEEEVQANGKVNVSSKAYGMGKIADILKENEAEIIWDDKTGQYYSQYEKEGKTYRVWLEDDRSLALKTALVEKYKLAGFAAWRKDFETEDVWDVIDKIIKKGISYDELEFNR